MWRFLCRNGYDAGIRTVILADDPFLTHHHAAANHLDPDPGAHEETKGNHRPAKLDEGPGNTLALSSSPVL